MKSILLRTLVGLCLAVNGWAQNAKPLDTPEIIQRREELIRNVQRAAVPVYQAYIQSLEPLRAQYTRERRADALEALQEEIKRVQKELEAATNAATRSNTAALQMTILSAQYGDHDKRKTANVTEKLRKAMRDGQTTITLNTTDAASGSDPAPFTKKETVITYTVNGQRKQKTFSEGHNLNFKDDLQ